MQLSSPTLSSHSLNLWRKNSCVNRDDTGNSSEDEEESEMDERVEAY